MPAERGTENLSVVYDHRGPRPVNTIIENGRSVTQLMGFLVSYFSCVPHVTANDRQFAQQICSEALGAAGPSFHGMVQITSFAGNIGWGLAQRRLSLRESTFAERKATNRPGGRRP